MPGTVAEFDGWIMDFKAVAQEIIDTRQLSMMFSPHSSLQSPTRPSRASRRRSPMNSARNELSRH
ncbi:BZ3500_MvSof-1268-A1-R1_C052g00212 [Microbotryum saponariae]|uniref:BZ3500_MvSof-1268-A1-R1_C052g00212 protein n=1 Tax=Microbotryum saponariae TaxID=289078 RepID=A0A2X0KP03_9BASI|nr:BZ3500_MvSof-1268-A1-R1_C052g00212 [Microbotryum saponariae]